MTGTGSRLVANAGFLRGRAGASNIRIGLVGYGAGGRHFHATFIVAAKGVELAGGAARATRTVAKVEADLPAVPIYPSLSAMLAAGVDAVTITTPPETRRGIGARSHSGGCARGRRQAIRAAGRELDAAAKAKGMVLRVFHNRRMDADVRTLKKVLDEGRLGKLWRLHSRMDLDDPLTLEAGPTGGLLRDLGSHLVDQMLWLLEPVLSVDAQIDMVERPQGPTDAGFVLTLRHARRTRGILSP